MGFVTRNVKTTTGPRKPRLHRAWVVAGISCLAIIAAGTFTTMSGLLVDPLHNEFDWSRGTIGIAVSVNMVLYGLAAPFAAALMDKVGIRRVIAGALLIITAGSALTTVMTASWQFVLFWGFLVGLGCGSVTMVFAATVANRWFVKRRGLVTGLLTAASVFGQFVFLPVLSSIVDQHQWRAAIMTIALTALIVVPFVWLLIRDHPADLGLKAFGARDFAPKPGPVPGVARRTLRVLGTSARTVPFWLLAFTFAICGATTNGIMWSHFAPAAHDHGMPITVAASLLAMIGIFNVVGTITSGWLTDRMDPRRLLSVYFALRGASLLLLPTLMSSTVQPEMIAFVIFFGILDVATVPPTIALCREFYGDDSAIVFGWINASHQIGAGLMAFLGGVARDITGSYTIVWITAGVLCFVAALIAVTIVRHTSSEKPILPPVLSCRGHFGQRN
ncbi:Predicted arabinose efflux permease, MFS family [Cryobacterium luteum]|uniref:MFS transporter n=1 Tax=Cryobacterium luteum TaxID=1424661 RepID=A0A1H8MAB8_9MICO|nr:MFS transporter [Cryobacterium luteum]SEO14178.1 Predicted arabinose efflux permease, MFS family [Cryobacterium luteum]